MSLWLTWGKELTLCELYNEHVCAFARTCTFCRDSRTGVSKHMCNQALYQKFSLWNSRQWSLITIYLFLHSGWGEKKKDIVKYRLPNGFSFTTSQVSRWNRRREARTLTAWESQCTRGLSAGRTQKCRHTHLTEKLQGKEILRFIWQIRE